MEIWLLRKMNSLRLMLVLWLMIFTVSGCGSGGIDNSDDETRKGSLSFQLAIDRPDSKSGKAVIAADFDICDYFHISTIQATVSNTDGESLGTGTWACSDHRGTLVDVPEGNNYHITVSGIESGRMEASWAGEASGISVSADIDTDAGKITLVYTDPLTAPEGVTVTPGDGLAKVSWHAVRQATDYTVYWGTSPGSYADSLSNITTTCATITGLSNATTYYVSVTAQNSEGEGSFSTEVTAFPQQTSRTLDRISLETPGTIPGEFGWSVTSGDFNGDGLIDVVVSDPVFDDVNSNIGAVFVYLGDTYFQTTPSQTLLDPEGVGSDQFGFYVSGVGDINGDGFDDLLVAMGWGVNRAYLFYGSESGLSLGNRMELLPPTGYDGYGFGHGISGGGYINGDRYYDFVVGTGGSYGCVYYGSSSGVSSQPNHVLSIGYEAANTYIECAVIGDINDDGYDDVALNNENVETSTSTTNRTDVFIYNGSSSGVNTPNGTLAIYVNEQIQGGFSVEINRAGDFSGDGFNDVIIGNQWASFDTSNKGEGRLYFGSSLGLNNSALILPNLSQTTNSRLGDSVDGIGDFNYDGFDDVVIGCPYGNFAEIYMGEPNPSSDISKLTLTGTSYFGWCVSRAGDIRGNGENFIIIGSEFGEAEVVAMHNDKPIARAGADQVITSDVICQLDGRGSLDGDGDILDHQWTIVSSPTDSSPVLSDAQSSTPLLYMDVAGEYTVELVVNDGLVDSEPDQVEITRD